MKAMTRSKYGPPEVVELREVDKPVPADDQVLVRIRAAALNRLDWYSLTGTPLIARPMTGLRGPKSPLFGADFAGTVEAVGSQVTELAPGDEVYGGSEGAFAEYVCARDGVALKPANLTFEKAAAVPAAGITALQGARDHGKLQPGEQVLVNGASGGVGSFAVQIAKALGGEVTAVCRTPHVELVGSLGADHVIDYTREDFTRGERRYDLVLDVAGSKRWSALKRVLTPQARVVVIGGPKDNAFLGPLGHIARIRVGALLSSQTAAFFVAKLNRPDLNTLRELIETGKVRPVIDRQYELDELPGALDYMGQGHAAAKVVVTVPEIPK